MNDNPLIPKKPVQAAIDSVEFADMIMASLKVEGIPFDRAMRILDTVGSYCIMSPDARKTKLSDALGTWKTREVKGD